MQHHPALHDPEELLPIREGFRETSEAGGIRYEVFKNSEIQTEIEGYKPGKELGRALTGWMYSYRGPGQRFSGDATARVGKHYTLVTQHVGLDI